MSLLRGRFLVILIALTTIFLMTGCGSDSSDSSKPQVKETQVAEKPKPAPQPLGEHWIKDSNGVYLWNPKPQDGETVTWSGGSVQDGDYKFAEGAGITTWYLNGEIEQIDEGSFKHGQRHGRFAHEFPSDRIIYSNWDNGVEIAEADSGTDNAAIAKKTFIDYHKAITDKNYREAYDTLSYKQRERVGDFDSFVAGFSNRISNEVSELNFVSSDEDSCPFDYTLKIRDRYNGNDVKVKTFKGQVTMAKDKGRWFIRYAKSDEVGKTDTPKVHSLQEHANYIVSHAKSKFNVNNYATTNVENLARYSAYLQMGKIYYDKEKRKNPQFSFSDNAEEEKRLLALFTYLDKEGSVASMYAVYKHPDYIKKMLKENHPLVIAGISIAEVNEAENQRDNSYNKLKNLNTISLTTDDEFRNLLKDLVKVLDDDFAENFGADGSKIDEVWRSVVNKYR